MNRFTLQLGSAAEVEQAHREFSSNGETAGITELGKLETANGAANFIFSDLDKNWWELTANPKLLFLKCGISHELAGFSLLLALLPMLLRETSVRYEDYKAYLQRLEKSATSSESGSISNHVHFLLETGPTPLGKFMQGLQQSCTQARSAESDFWVHVYSSLLRPRLSSDHLIRPRQDVRRDRQDHLLRGFEVYDELVFSRPLHRKVCRFVPFKILSTKYAVRRYSSVGLGP